MKKGLIHNQLNESLKIRKRILFESLMKSYTDSIMHNIDDPEMDKKKKQWKRLNKKDKMKNYFKG